MKKANPSTMKRIIKFISPYKSYFIIALFMAIISVAGSLYVPVLIGQGIDFILGKDNVDFQGIAKILLEIGIIVLIAAFAQWIMSLCTNRISYCTVKDIRERALAQIEVMPLKSLDSMSHGDLISRIITDVDQISDGLLMGFTQLFTGIVAIVGTIGFMLSINLQITLVVVLITPVSLFVASFIAKRTFSLFQKQSETRGEITALVDEYIGNQKIVKAFGYEQEAQIKFDEVNEQLRIWGTKAIFVSSITNPATRVVNGLVYTSVGIIGAFTAINGMLTIGQLSCFLSYANQYTKPFNEISGVIAELQSALASAKRVFEIIDEVPQKPEPENAIVLSKVDGRVLLDHVTFSYNPEIPLIENLNLDVAPGQRIAVVGPTGCGKTTMINLLMRFYDVKFGQIKVSGIPIPDVTRDSLRSMYGMVLQDSWLKTGSIRENIAFSKNNASYEEIVEAAKAAHAHSFIERLPNGYDTNVSEDGGNLSQGQKQLLCIARVMLALPPMLILDEATSSIDTRTERQIQDAFDKMMQGRTTFIVAHRLSTIQKADQILVMDHGQIIEQGKHDELLKQNGFYHHLYYSQFNLRNK